MSAETPSDSPETQLGGSSAAAGPRSDVGTAPAGTPPELPAGHQAVDGTAPDAGGDRSVDAVDGSGDGSVDAGDGSGDGSVDAADSGPEAADPAREPAPDPAHEPAPDPAREPAPDPTDEPGAAPGPDPADAAGVAVPVARSRRWVKVLVSVAVVLVVLAGAALVGGKILLDRYTGHIRQGKLLGGAAVDAPHNLATVDGPINILLVGVDARGDANEMIRSDSVIILHVPATHDRAYLISIPRDSDVQIPAFPRTGYQGGDEKIDAAFAYGSANGGGRAGGFELLATTIKNLTGIGFNAGAIVDFEGFRSVVNAMGGVYLCVDEEVTSIHIGTDSSGRVAAPYEETAGGDLIPVPGIKPMVYHPGCQQMAGWQALDYVRQRKLIADGDYGRTRHQQQFLKAMFTKATSAGVMTDPGKLDSVLRAAGAALTVDLNGVPATNWLFTLRNIAQGGVTMVKTNGGQFNSFWVGDELREHLTADSMQLLQSVRDDNVDTFLAAHPTWIASDGETVTLSPSAGRSRE